MYRAAPRYRLSRGLVIVQKDETQYTFSSSGIDTDEIRPRTQDVSRYDDHHQFSLAPDVAATEETGRTVSSTSLSARETQLAANQDRPQEVGQCLSMCVSLIMAEFHLPTTGQCIH